MVFIQNLTDAPTLRLFCDQVEAEEGASKRHVVEAYNLKLEEDGTLTIKGNALEGVFRVSDEAQRCMARLAEIPVPYFGKCDAGLRAISFNRRLRQVVAEREPVQIVFHEDLVDRVLKSKLLPAPRAPILETILNATPEGVERDDLRVLEHQWNGTFDISVIAPSRTCEPRPGDTVAFGVNVREGNEGSIQVQGASFRLVCKNGALHRTCSENEHRIRRPPNQPERQEQLLNRIEARVREAWNQQGANEAGIRKLTQIRFDPQDANALMSRLRQAPFFLPAKVTDRIINQVGIEGQSVEGAPTVYELWNAMTFLANHGENLSETYRLRLRFGAGELARSGSRICEACRQVVLSTRQS